MITLSCSRDVLADQTRQQRWQPGPLAIELSAEQTRSPPPMLPNATLRADVEPHSVPASVARPLADFPIAAPTREVQSA